MATVNQICAAIIECVTNSGLDFNINQTPYSVHFSLRKKLSKISSKPHFTPSNSLDPKPEHQDDRLRQELLHTRNEYVKLHDFYMMECQAKQKVEDEFKDALEKLNTIENNNRNIKTLETENKHLKEKYDHKVLEVKQLKSDLENVSKDKNSLSVALKSAKADVKDQSKQFDKKKLELENKIVELSEYRRLKLAEEREVKLKNKKELKKERQKEKRELQQTNVEKNVDKTEPESKPADNSACQDNVAKKDINENVVLEDTHNDDELTTGDTNNYEKKLTDETAEPRLMDEEEKEAFLKEIFAKVDRTLEKMYPAR